MFAISSNFVPELREVAADVGADAEDMARVMFSESGLEHDAHNPNGDASGIIQFMPDTLKHVGWMKGDAAFRNLSAVEQLPYVRRYYMPYKGYLNSAAQVYTATFIPAVVKQASDPDFVIAAKGGPFGWAFDANAILDIDGDKKIQVRELGQRVLNNCKGPHWDAIAVQFGDRELTTWDPLDLGTVFGVQTALNDCGFDCGPADGKLGPKTRAAILSFQRASNLKADGIFGPLTRAALSSLAA